jgi:hypothetical protein
VCDAGTVKFGFEQRWEATPDDVLEVYIDPDFWSSMDGLSKTAPPSVLGVERSADTVLVRLRYQLSVDLPSQASRFIDPDDVAWVEETTWQLTKRTATVRFLPEQAAGLLRASATASLQADGVDTTREVRGELKVRIPLVGGKVEHAIVDGIGTTLEEEAQAVANRLG